MPNGGSDCCGTCHQNKANREKNSQDHYCLLREVAISDPFWTYCANWPGLLKHAARTVPNCPIPYGPIYGNGIYAGYIRIPWNGKYEPETYVSGHCHITGETFEKNGIKVYVEELGTDLYFAGNYQYYQWYQNRYPDMPLPYKYDLDDYISDIRTDLHRIYTEIYKQGYLCVDFIHKGNDPLLPGKVDIDKMLPRMQGALIGGAVGDALGRGVEGKNPDGQRIETYIPWSGWQQGPVGTITDDTQLTMQLAQSLLENKGFLPSDIAERFSSHHIRGIGAATREFVRNHKDKKMLWFAAGVSSAGNGAAMRAAPIGMYYVKHPEDIKLGAGLQAMITHNNPMALASSIVMARATAYLLSTEKHELSSLEKRLQFCHEIADVIAGIEDGKDYCRNHSDEQSSLYQRIRYAIPAYLEKEETPCTVQQDFWSGAYVLESLPFALYCFLYSPGDFRQTLLTAVNESRDSDTVAAMACTLSGAYNGVDAIPSYYRSKENLEYYTELMELSRQLWRAVSGK